MRIAVVSDIHGNQVALEAVLEDITRQPEINQIVVAGDLCLNGPRPREVLDILQALHFPVIQGNVDADVVNDIEKRKGKKRESVNWTRAQIGKRGIDYLASLPFSHLVENPGGNDLLVVHANPLNMDDHVTPGMPEKELEHLFGSLSPTVGAVAFGHLHIAYLRHWHHLLLVDVGSCGLPRDGDQRAAYAILGWQDGSWRAEHRRIEYDIKTVVKQLKSSGIPNVEKRIKILVEAQY